MVIPKDTTKLGYGRTTFAFVLQNAFSQGMFKHHATRKLSIAHITSTLLTHWTFCRAGICDRTGLKNKKIKGSSGGGNSSGGGSEDATLHLFRDALRCVYISGYAHYFEKPAVK